MTDLREQDLNAQVMQPAEYQRLVENIRNRGALESLPYCAQPPGQDYVNDVSGHHRVRAAFEAGMSDVWAMVDTSALTRSQTTAKRSPTTSSSVGLDEAVLRQLLDRVINVDDLLETGLPERFMPSPPSDAVAILTPAADFDWRTISFAFLPHQLTDFDALIARLDGRQDLVAVAPLDVYDSFVKALGGFQRVRKVTSAGTAIALLTRMALDYVAAQEVKPDEPTPGDA